MSPFAPTVSSARARSGSALIVVIWVVALLSMMIVSMAFDAHIEARMTSYYRKRGKATYLARSGIEIARMILEKRGEVSANGEPTEDQKSDRWFASARQLKKGAIRGLSEPLGEGTVTLDIVPEPARRNINNLDLQNNRNLDEVERNLERILEVGGITEDTGMWPELIDSFIDWIDADDSRRADGAETDDYYATLKPPYKAANRPLDTVEELLLVKGFTRTVLFGGSLEPAFGEDKPRQISGIADLLTTYGDGRVNVNSASQRVLMTLQDVDEVVAGYIIEEREGYTTSDGRHEATPFENDEEFLRRVTDVNPATLRRYVTTADSQTVRITAVGEVGGVKRTIWCIGEFAGREIRILRWREED